MYFIPILLLTSLLPLTITAETVLGIYILSRHGDRSSKSTPPTNLTTLGYSQVFTSGSYFRSRYVSSSASSPILGISHDLVNFKQIAASAPLDTVLMPSAQGFLQGLYPPVGNQLGVQTLRNKTEVQTPLDGYQLIPVQTVTTGTASEDSAWLQGAGNCANAITSSNEYLSTPEYQDLLNSTSDFYKSLAPVVNATFGEDFLSYKNAYASEPPSPVPMPHDPLANIRLLSLRPHQRSYNPQRQHPILLPPHTLHPLPTLLPRQHSRALPRLQQQRPNSRHRRLNPRRTGRPSPQHHPHGIIPRPENQHPIRRLWFLPIFLQSR